MKCVWLDSKIFVFHNDYDVDDDDYDVDDGNHAVNGGDVGEVIGGDDDDD